MEYRLSGAGLPSDRVGQPAPQASAPVRPISSARKAQSNAPTPPPVPQADGPFQRCPVCNSPSCGQFVAALVADQTREGQSVSVFTLGEETGVSRTASRSQTLTAQFLSVPQSPSCYPWLPALVFWAGLIVWTFFMLFAGVLVSALVQDGRETGLALTEAWVVGLAFIPVYIFITRAVWKAWHRAYAPWKQSWPARMARWERGMELWNQAVYCRRNGRVWIPTGQTFPSDQAIVGIFEGPLTNA